MLTAKQESFCQAILEGNDQRAAYIAAYSVSGMKDSTIREEASRLAANPNIATTIAEARQRNRDWTMATVLADCDTNLAGARKDHQWSAANAIVATGAKVAGILTDKVDINVTHTLKPGLSLEELEARVSRLDALEAGVVDGTSKIINDPATVALEADDTLPSAPQDAGDS